MTEREKEDTEQFLEHLLYKNVIIPENWRTDPRFDLQWKGMVSNFQFFFSFSIIVISFTGKVSAGNAGVLICLGKHRISPVREEELSIIRRLKILAHVFLSTIFAGGSLQKL